MSCYSSFSIIHVSVVVLKVTFDIGLHAVGGRTTDGHVIANFLASIVDHFFLTQLSNYWTQEVRLLWSPATTEMIVNLIFCSIICSRYLTRKIGFEAVMRVRCTKGKLQVKFMLKLFAP